MTKVNDVSYMRCVMGPNGCVRCGAPFHAHGPDGQCDPDAVAACDATRSEKSADKATDKKTRAAILAGIAVGVLSAGAMIASCLNSGISYRQMRAAEEIAKSLAHSAPCVKESAK